MAQLQKKADTIVRLLSEIDDLGTMVQSVRINPAYADGSVKAEFGTLSFTVTVTPAEAISGVKNLAGCLKLYADKVEVKTKAGAFAEIPVTKAEIIDKAKGEVSIEANVSEYLPAEKTRTLSVALNVRTGVSNYTTEFVTVNNHIPDYLPGLFTVNGEGKQVRFSKGNLKYTFATKTWEFFDRQYDFDPGVNQESSTEYVSLFCWGYTQGEDGSIARAHKKYVTGYSRSNFDYGEDWGSQVEPKGIWRTPTKDEWVYFMNERKGARYALSKLVLSEMDTVAGVILFPDNDATVSKEGKAIIGNVEVQNVNKSNISFAEVSAENWARLEAAGSVFLPCAGYRGGQYDVTIKDIGEPNYWSSTSPSSETSAYLLTFFNGNIKPTINSNRDIGRSVRLVTDVE